MRRIVVVSALGQDVILDLALYKFGIFIIIYLSKIATYDVTRVTETTMTL